MNGSELKIIVSKSYLLMVLDEQKGGSYSRGFESLGFAGALLMDLFLQDRIMLTGSNVEIIDSKSTGNDFLDPILEIIANSEKKRSLINWIDRLSQKFTQDYNLYFDLMEKQGILKSEVKPHLKAKLYYLQKPELKSQILEEIQNFINNNIEPKIEVLCLLVLLDESGLIKVYLSRDIRKKAKTRIKEMLYSEHLDSSKREMISNIKKEIVNLEGARNMFMRDES